MTLALRQVHVGDCRDLLRQMDDESVNCVVTSPPYWGLRDYGVAGQLGLEATPTEYVANMVEVFKEVRRVLRPEGTLWLNLGDCYATGAGKVGDCQGGGEQGARWRGDVDRPRDDKRGYRGERLANEFVFLLSKSERYQYDAAAIRERQLAPEASTPDDAARAFSRRRAAAVEPRQGALTADAVGAPRSRNRSGNKERVRRDGNGGVYGHGAHQAFGVPWQDTDGMRNKRSVWTIATEPYGGAHFATFPKKLVEPCILAGCPAGGVVLDPFGGSGTVGEVAEALGRNWILLEISAEYSDLAAARTSQRGLFVEAGGRK